MIQWRTLRIDLLGPVDRSASVPDLPVPSFPQAVREFSKLADDENATPKKLAAVLDTDAALSVELVKYANSSAIGLRHQVASTQQVLTILGVRRVRNFLNQVVLGRISRSCKTKLINPELFAESNFERAAFAKRAAAALKLDAEVAYTGGLVQDFLLPLLIQENETAYKTYFDQLRETTSLANFERETFGWDHGQAAASLMAGWDFPDDLICCVFLHHHWESIRADHDFLGDLTGPIGASALLPGALAQVPTGPASLREFATKQPQIDLDEIIAGVDADVLEIFAERKGTLLVERLQTDVEAVSQPASA